MSMHKKFINAPCWHIFCIQKSYCLHKSVSQARPKNQHLCRPIEKQYWLSSNPIGQQYYKYYGTKSQAFYCITMVFILFYIGFYSIVVVLLLVRVCCCCCCCARTSLSVLLLCPYEFVGIVIFVRRTPPVAACVSLLLLLLLLLLLYRATISIIIR